MSQLAEPGILEVFSLFFDPVEAQLCLSRMTHSG
jgi:hypothetical protein